MHLWNLQRRKGLIGMIHFAFWGRWLWLKNIPWRWSERKSLLRWRREGITGKHFFILGTLEELVWRAAG